jgi:hypothetical protein
MGSGVRVIVAVGVKVEVGVPVFVGVSISVNVGSVDGLASAVSAGGLAGAALPEMVQPGVPAARKIAIHKIHFFRIVSSQSYLRFIQYVTQLDNPL